jgi:RHS repeat-associated protein
MVGAYVDAQLKATYLYNGQGQRVKKTEATGAERTIVYHYGLSGELLGETVYSDTGAKIGERDYVWIDSLPIAQSERTFSGSTVTSDTLVYLHADQLETPRLATDDSGTVVWRWDSDAFGIGEADQDPDSDTEEVNVRLRFPGQYWDEETGLHYNYFRDYDPVTGRYVESDPIGYGGGINTYAYVDDNPVGYVDPYGLWTDARWLSGPGLSDVSINELGWVGPRFWRVLPPAIGLFGRRFQGTAVISGKLECIDEQECGSKSEVFDVEISVSKTFIIGVALGFARPVQIARSGAEGALNAYDMFTNYYKPTVDWMRDHPLTICYVVGSLL